MFAKHPISGPPRNNAQRDRYTPAIWLPLAAVVFLVDIGLYAWRHRDVPGGKPFLAMSVMTIPILLSIALEAAAVAPETR